MDALFNHLLANCAIILFGILAWTNVPQRKRQHGLPSSVRFGLFFGVCAMAVMLRPYEIQPGVYVDLRTVPLSIAGLVGGWPAGVVAASMASLLRIWLGGAGALPGVTVIVLTTGVGILASVWLDRRYANYREIAAFSALVALADLVALLVFTRSSALEEMQGGAPFWVGLVFVATIFGSLAVFAELRRRDTNQSLKMYEAAIQSLPESLNVKDKEGRFLLANAATAQLMNQESAEFLLGRTIHDFYPSDIADMFRKEELDVLSQQCARMSEQEFVHKDGRHLVLSTLKAPLHDETGALLGLVTHNRDLTEKKRLLRALAESEKRVNIALSNMADGLIMFDAKLDVVFCNDQYRAMFPLTADVRIPGVPARTILETAIERGEFKDIAPEKVTEFIEGAMSRLRLPGVVQFPLHDGRWVESRTTPSDDGGCLVVCSDITRSKRDEEELRQLNVKLSEMAMIDSLTELLNRRAFDTALASEIGHCQARGSTLSLLMIDVDRFKAYNDTYGHTTGDDCLRRVAQVVRSIAQRPGDRAARYGGEEMAVVLPNASEEGALALAHELRTRIRALDISHIGSEKGVVTVSIGTATLNGFSRGVTPVQLIRNADEALYRAKASGRDAVRSWEKSGFEPKGNARVADASS